MNIQFQEENVNWLESQYNSGLKRLLIADETGLGKTYTAAGIIYRLADSKLKKQNKKQKNKFVVLYICSNQMIARKNMRELCDKLLELKNGNDMLLTKKDAKKFSSSFGDRLSMPFEMTKDSFIQLRNCTVETTFETYHDCVQKGSELYEMKKHFKDEYTKAEIIDPENNNKRIEGNVYAELRRKLIGKKMLNYDLVIIDEFQSYEQVLSKYFPAPCNNKVARLYIDELFRDTKLLMLSATPYRMTDTDKILNEKLDDLGRVIKFLAEGSTNTAVCNTFKNYVDCLNNSKCSFNDLLNNKALFENDFKQLCRRNQRLHVIQSNDFYDGPIYHGNIDYGESLKKEMPLMKAYESVRNDIIDTEKKSQTLSDDDPKKQSILTASKVRQCPYPAAFFKGERRWDKNYKTYNDSKYSQLFPKLYLDMNASPTSCEYDLCGVETSDNNCKRIMDMCRVSFDNCSTRAACAEQLIDALGNGEIFKCAWIPSSKSRSLKPPFSEIGSDPSKLLVFSKHTMTCRWIAAYLSSKSFCKDSTRVENAKKEVSQNAEAVLHKQCMRALEMCKIDNEQLKKAVASFFTGNLKEYFLREPVVHVLANAGVGTSVSFEKYVQAGDLASTLEEYFFVTHLKSTLNNLDKSTLNNLDRAVRVQNYITSKGLKIRIDENGNVESDVIATIIQDMLENAKKSNDDLLLDGDNKDSKQTLCAFETYVKICKDPNNAAYIINKAEQKYKIPRDDKYICWFVDHCSAIQSIHDYRDMIINGNNLANARYKPIKKCCLDVKKFTESQIKLAAEKYGSCYGVKGKAVNDKKFILGQVGIIQNHILSVLRSALLCSVGELELFPQQKVCVGFTDSGNVIKCGRLPLGFACRFTEASQDSDDNNIKDQERMMRAFNTPFFPFVLISTDCGKEGISFHSYCRRILHLDPAVMPSDLIQRNGRIDRFCSLAIRQRAVRVGEGETWEILFDSINKNDDDSGMVPYWYISSKDGARIEEHVFNVSASLEESETDKLYESTGIYKQLIGSCLPEEMIDELHKRYPNENLEQLNLVLK